MVINNNFKKQCEKCPYVEPIASASIMHCDGAVFESVINVSCSKMDLCTQLQNYLGDSCAASDGPGVIFTKK